VALLSAWAARGPNDSTGQGLLADALRIDPASKAAQQAFERMEGISGQHAELEAAMLAFNADELAKLQKAAEGPTFRGAQIGFNNNIRAKDQVFHIQTEDSGLNSPHVITHLFADGGRVVKSHKRSYAAVVETEPDIGLYVRKLMKAQHLEMVFSLRDGQFDDILAGKRAGGLEVLETYPDVDLAKLGAGKSSGARNRVAEAKAKTATAPTAAVSQGSESSPSEPVPPPQPVAQRPQAPPATVPRESPAVVPPLPPSRVGRPKPAAQPAAAKLYTLHVLRSLGGGPGRYEVGRRETVIGADGEIALPGEKFCHPREAVLRYRDGRLTLDTLEGENGVFLRIHKPVAVQFGQEFIVGDQLLRVEENPVSDDAPDPDPTYFYSSPRWPSSFRVVQVFEGGASGACLVARGSTLQVGAVLGDLILSDDPLVDPQHCLVEEQAGTIILSDLDSRNGVFVRGRKSEELLNGDEIVIGRTHLVVDIEGTA
jgi:hypothetical protein